MLRRGLTEGWRGRKRWRLRELVEEVGDRLFLQGHDEEGAPALTTLRDFMRESPDRVGEAQIFDPAFEEDCPELLLDFDVPPDFAGRNDLFHLLGPQRPDFRWFLVGRAGQQTPWHVDPLGTSAWHALMEGEKRWRVLEPKDLHAWQERVFEAKEMSSRRLVDEAKQQGHGWIEILQRPGDVVVIPSSYPHEVTNLQDSVAITQNFVNESNLVYAYRFLKRACPDKAARFQELLQQHMPDLSTLIQERGFRDSSMVTAGGKRQERENSHLKEYT